ncbi:hypothetical protein GLOIN_2v1477473 [Rhizophagus clarus]|uniref:HTH myb-type domain-containing protein n=1 Tax=Rhizophagus clarus TaxID=94130 RepID=A0A8H3KZY8_9GLOM|nr:hypothetical protein GLOIN_2v1477473 [Rhizophagus clarus]
MPRFSKESNDIILRYMNEWKKSGKERRKDPFVYLSTKIPHNHKQICYYWYNKLDPKLCKMPLTNNEQDHIIDWVERYLMYNVNQQNIPWKKLQKEMKSVFNKLHSTNVIKNFWNSRKRRLMREAENILNPLIFDNYLVMGGQLFIVTRQ